ncbi:hypothetical protein TGAMA5MH_09009 [Trichoderma gamsii]|uniref:AB hydrolase-1 domain-containing protein n=1 Tax=Trichoderma gamsii TaxID=398673 RepID=A0A2K0SZS8_9HYPO|nr:hypothetical protein TGAMA5MH_09009 [Trichoderma gamsii]
MVLKLASLAFVAFATFVAGQTTQAALHSTSWNSTFVLSPEQRELGNLTEELADQINNIINFDRTLVANGGPHEDECYSLPIDLQIPKQPGKLLKLQEVTDLSPFAIPATTAMSRFIYSTINFNGTLIPASAYILWPYHAKKIGGAKGQKVPTILWTHGTSGFYATGAPSTHRSLFYQDFVPYALALAGYAVVAPDYAGLGVGTSWDASSIPHQYGLYQAGAGDALNALRAALNAFPERLTSNYVSVGHSQGGSVGWGVPELLAQRNGQFNDLIKGHLGTILFAPQTDGFSLPPKALLIWVGKYLRQVFPTFKLSDWLIPLGVDRVELFDQVEGSQMVSTFLFQPEEEIVQPDWKNTWEAAALQQLANPGNRPYKGPMLVIQGDKDPAVNYNSTLATAKSTCKEYPGDLEFLGVPGVGHFPGMYATRSIWMDWIQDRFEGRHVQKRGCVQSTVDRFLPEDNYQSAPNAFPLWAGKAQWAYELPQGH